MYKNKGQHGTDPWCTECYISRIEMSPSETGSTITMALTYRQKAMVKMQIMTR